MKNFDIEKLDRKMPYKLPDNTFETVQKNVLEKTVGKKQEPIYNLKWFYAAAAVILFIIGFNFIINSNGKTEPFGETKQVAKNTVVDQTVHGTEIKDQNQYLAQNDTDDSSKNNSGESDLTSSQVSNLNVKSKTQTVASVPKPSRNITAVEEKVDDVLDGFSSSEIASLSNNSEQDVYLDLYN